MAIQILLSMNAVDQDLGNVACLEGTSWEAEIELAARIVIQLDGAFEFGCEIVSERAATSQPLADTTHTQAAHDIGLHRPGILHMLDGLSQARCEPRSMHDELSEACRIGIAKP